jgi:hypothetical protein
VHRDAAARRESRPPGEEIRVACADAVFSFRHRNSFQRCSRASAKKKRCGAPPRSVSTGARKGSGSTSLERLQPGEQGFREPPAFYSLAGRLRADAELVSARLLHETSLSVV